MSALRVKIAPMLQKVVGSDGRLDFAAISSGAWRSQLFPLSWKDVEEVASNIRDVKIANEDYEAFYLFDRDYIAFGNGMRDGHPTAVYPYSAMQLVTLEDAEAQLSMYQPIVDGLNSVRSSSSGSSRLDGVGNVVRDSVIREGVKAAFDHAKEHAAPQMESLRDIAMGLWDQCVG